MSNVMLVNITWNPNGWRDNNYVNPRAGHAWARKNVGGESLNFNFNKKTVDTADKVHGYFRFTRAPKKYENGGLIFFYTNNTDKHKGQIVGLYGNANALDEYIGSNVPFQNNPYYTNINGEKRFSMLFPIALDIVNYKKTSKERLVGQVGFSYKDMAFAEKILFGELTELQNSGSNEKDFNQLVSIYEYFIGKKFKTNFIKSDEKEQFEIEKYYKNKSRHEILNDLLNLKEKQPELVTIKGKVYKRDNKTIAQIKIIRGAKCQICGWTCNKVDGTAYIEAAHIIAKHLKGGETPGNIILLCPNHHKEFDLCHRSEVKLKENDVIIFSLNNKLYEVDMKLS